MRKVKAVCLPWSPYTAGIPPLSRLSLSTCFLVVSGVGGSFGVDEALGKAVAVC